MFYSTTSERAEIYRVISLKKKKHNFFPLSFVSLWVSDTEGTKIFKMYNK